MQNVSIFGEPLYVTYTIAYKAWKEIDLFVEFDDQKELKSFEVINVEVRNRHRFLPMFLA